MLYSLTRQLHTPDYITPFFTTYYYYYYYYYYKSGRGSSSFTLMTYFESPLPPLSLVLLLGKPDIRRDSLGGAKRFILLSPSRLLGLLLPSPSRLFDLLLPSSEAALSASSLLVLMRHKREHENYSLPHYYYYYYYYLPTHLFLSRAPTTVVFLGFFLFITMAVWNLNDSSKGWYSISCRNRGRVQSNRETSLTSHS